VKSNDSRPEQTVVTSNLPMFYKETEFFHSIQISVDNLELCVSSFHALYNPSLLPNDLVEIFSRVSFRAVYFSATKQSHQRLAKFCRNETQEDVLIAALPLESIFCSVSSMNITITSEIVQLLRDISINILQILGLVDKVAKQEKNKTSENASVLNSLMRFYEEQKKLRKKISCTTSIGTHVDYLELPRFLEKCITKKLEFETKKLEFESSFLLLFYFLYNVFTNVKEIAWCLFHPL
jgi:hypothetical protein